MTRTLYDHKTLDEPDDEPANDSKLDELGKEGWQLVSVVQSKKTYRWHYFFVRPYQDEG